MRGTAVHPGEFGTVTPPTIAGRQPSKTGNSTEGIFRNVGFENKVRKRVEIVSPEGKPGFACYPEENSRGKLGVWGGMSREYQF